MPLAISCCNDFYIHMYIVDFQIMFSAGEPDFAPSRLIDFELEMAFFTGGPVNQLGDSIPIGGC